jgi:hypothetical protein
VGSPGPAVKIPGVYTFGQKGECWERVENAVANEVVELYFYADVGNETYDIRDYAEPKPVVWKG